MPENKILDQIRTGDVRALARAITMVENELSGADELLASLNMEEAAPLIGITGPPGAGKSTLINALISQLTSAGKKIAVIAVDPTSPFNFGSVLGDRLRMSEHFTNPNVFIRSLATRGSLGGLSEKAMEVTDLVRAAGFDLVIVETVGVGQSEVEIAGLADTTLLVLVPESGDDVQALKSGIMEIADIFVVNKSDRPGANTFIRNIGHVLHKQADSDWTPCVVKTVASRNEGLEELIEKMNEHRKYAGTNKRKAFLYTEKAWRLIRRERMRGIDKNVIYNEIAAQLSSGTLQLYRFVKEFTF
jgi:LAO/AO transport system kinase